MQALLSVPCQVLLHEFGHVLEGYYGSRPGVSIPCLHCATEYGYPGGMADRDHPAWLQDWFQVGPRTAACLGGDGVGGLGGSCCGTCGRVGPVRGGEPEEGK